MGTAWLAAVGILFVAFQALESTEEPKCVPGFKSDVLIFRVTRKHLGPGARLGRGSLREWSLSQFILGKRWGG
ncbi:unnamed protein product [Pleuronectes platessa]|uniref:Uncharacterized protein n=1 Tax=Pleuronectes platessa TaxID=8262 RepID=A0A9N7YXZ2_PLEPL|nr:unnamed protein product [Pleuronectes platessa]